MLKDYYVVTDNLSNGSIESNIYSRQQIEGNKKLNKLIQKGGLHNSKMRRSVVGCTDERQAQRVYNESFI